MRRNGKTPAAICDPKRIQTIGHSTKIAMTGTSSPNCVGPATCGHGGPPPEPTMTASSRTPLGILSARPNAPNAAADVRTGVPLMGWPRSQRGFKNGRPSRKARPALMP